MKIELSSELIAHYERVRTDIKARLADFKSIKPDEYFYELCYCICTPQSKAAAAAQVQKKLMDLDFFNSKFDPTSILLDKTHYIRFHNQKAKRLLEAIELFPIVSQILQESAPAQSKRLQLNSIIKGMGMKECSHFLRNIGEEGLAILDRHILKHLVKAGIYQEVPNISSVNNYLKVEEQFTALAGVVKIPIDELDLLFWSYENGNILK